MKKILVIIASLFVLLLASCKTISNSSDSTITLYNDSKQYETEKFKLEIDGIFCYKANSNYNLSISLILTNKELETELYSLTYVNVIKEDTNVKYDVSHDSLISLDAELSKKLLLTSTIPSHIDTDNYKLSFTLESIDFVLCLYEKPDELREDRTIRYHILNKVVKTDTVKDGRTINKIYTYESSDNLSYCSMWYLDSNYKTKLTSSTIINEDIDLYGIESSNIKFTTTSSDTWSFVSGVNHVPSNGILILPEKYLNKELAMGNYAIKDINVSKIYIPKTMHTIYMGNFKNIGNATIYYEGTEAEWKALFYSTSDIVTTNVVYNTKAPK